MDFILKLVFKKGSIHTCTHLSNLILFKNKSIYTNHKLDCNNAFKHLCCSNLSFELYSSLSLSLLQNLVYELYNILFTVAYKRTAVLSGTLDSNHSSSLVVDGVTLCPQNSNLVAVSNWSPVPWLMIQLDTTYYIEKVVFYAGDGVYGEL